MLNIPAYAELARRYQISEPDKIYLESTQAIAFMRESCKVTAVAHGIISLLIIKFEYDATYPLVFAATTGALWGGFHMFAKYLEPEAQQLVARWRAQRIAEVTPRRQ